MCQPVNSFIQIGFMDIHVYEMLCTMCGAISDIYAGTCTKDFCILEPIKARICTALALLWMPLLWFHLHLHLLCDAGTLTENRMTVVEGWFSGTKHKSPPRLDQMPGDVGQEIINNICMNSKAFYIEEPGKKIEYVGNRTECALLQLCQKSFGVPYDSVRKQNEGKVVQVGTLSLDCVICNKACR
jgi:hypothetical protein